MRREEKFASAKQAHINANILIDELGPDAERLKLAIDQNLNFLPIYHETLSNQIRSEIELSLKQNLKEQYSCKNVDVSSTVYFVGPDPGDFLLHGEFGVVDSPDLLTLRVSQIVMSYFNEHPWLNKLNIYTPEISVLAENVKGHKGSGASPAGEYVLVRNFFSGKLTPKNAQLIIDIGEIGLEFEHDGDEISVLRGVAHKM